jgi:hypothetical protein
VLEEVVCVEVAELLRGVLELDVSTLDVPEVRAALADVGRVQSCVDGVKVTLSRRLSELVTVAPSMSPDHEIAKGTRSSLRDAEKVGERAKVLDRNPTLEDKLRAGEVSAEHVDVLGRGAKQLEPAQRESLFGEHGERLAEIAARATPEEFARAVKQTVNQVSADDGLSRLERQKRATRLRTWTDRDTGWFTSTVSSTRSPGSRSSAGCTTRSRNCSTTRSRTPVRPTRSTSRITCARWR